MKAIMAEDVYGVRKQIRKGVRNASLTPCLNLWQLIILFCYTAILIILPQE